VAWKLWLSFMRLLVAPDTEYGRKSETTSLNADLGHVGPTRARRTAEPPSSVLGREKQDDGRACKEKPHESGASLNLTAALLVIVGAIPNPACRQREGIDVAAVWSP